MPTTLMIQCVALFRLSRKISLVTSCSYRAAVVGHVLPRPLEDLIPQEEQRQAPAGGRRAAAAI